MLDMKNSHIRQAQCKQGFIAFPVLIAIVVAVLAVGGGAYVYMNNKGGNQPAVVNPGINATQTAQTADWKTYIDPDNRFSLEYPSTLTINSERSAHNQVDTVSFQLSSSTIIQVSIFSTNSRWPDLKSLVNDQYLMSKDYSQPAPVFKILIGGLKVQDVGGNSVTGHVFVGQLNQSQFIVFTFDDENLINKTLSSFKLLTNSQTANWKTYTNYAFGFSVKLPSNNNVYTCEDIPPRAKLANEKNYSVFILENPSDIDLIKSCDYSETAKYNRLTINARRQHPDEYSGFVENWKRVHGDGKYAIVKEISFAQHDALLKTKVEVPNNNNPYKEMIINGGTYFYSIGLDKKSDSLEKILSTFEIIAAKDKFSDWQTIKSDDLEIEIKYPYNYRADIVASGITIYPVPQPIEFGPYLDVSKKLIPIDTDINTYVNNLFQENVSVKERGYQSINGVQWTKVKYLSMSGDGPDRTYVNYFAIRNEFMYRIVYGESAINNDNFEKIAGTIKFNR